MNSQPVVPAGPPDSGGPWAWKRLILPAGMAILLVVLMAVHFVSLAFSTSKETPQEKAARKQAQQYAQTIPASPSDVAGFTTQTQNTAADLGKRSVSAGNLANLLAAGGVPSTGANPLAVPGNPLNTDPRLYRQWADADAAARQGAYSGTPTPAGQPAPNNSSGSAASGNSSAEEKREAARKRERQRLAASSIAVDFTRSAIELKPELQPMEASHEPTAIPATPSTVEASEPKALKEHMCFELCEGDILATVLTNRIDGSQAGFADVMVTEPVFSHDWDPQGRRLLIPVGSRVLGNVTAVNGSQTQRLFVAFHKLRRPDGSTFSLDNFTGLDMAGSSGLRDLVNHHYLMTFGVAGAIAAIGAVAQVGNSTSGFGYDPTISIRNGLSQGLGQESAQVLNRFLSQAPTMTVREGKNLVKVYFSSDVTIPAYKKEVAYAR